MFLKQFFIDGLAHASYMIGAEGEAAIIDPRRDVDIYIKEAKTRGLQITHVIETHLHADFISGHLELTQQTGARVCMPKSAEAQYDHLPLVDGDEIGLGNMRMSVMETPGHTPEHICLVVSDLLRAEDPWIAFTGDALFVGDVGRPDLFGPQRAEELCDQLFDSLHQKLGSLPDFVEVYPAHGEGSLCGRNLSAKRCSTIGYEKRYNRAFKPYSKESLRDEILKDMPLAPRYFHRTSEINRNGPKVLGQSPQMKEVPAREAKGLLDGGHLLIDVRTAEAFGGAHIPGTYNIWFGPSLSTWAGWVVPYERPILVLLDDLDHSEEMVRQLIRVGFDDIAGYIEGGIEAWMAAGLPITTLPQISVHQLREMLAKREKIIVTDVRTPAEYREGHIAGALNIHAGQIHERHDELNKDDMIAVVCRSAHRSGIAASLLEQKGFNNVHNVSGGMTAWMNAGYPVQR